MPGAPLRDAPRLAWRHGQPSQGSRAIPAEVAVALNYDGTTHAVMMATPSDLKDFAIGFSLTEGVIASPAEILDIEVVELPLGMDLRISLSDRSAERLWQRRRAMAGPVGCGLCGLESLAEAMRPLPVLPPGMAFEAEALTAAMQALPARQPLNLASHALHAAGFWSPRAGLLAVREDVGRHNALDKLCGAMARQGQDQGRDHAGPMAGGAALLTSRVSVEMVQKLAMAGCPLLVAVSAPTALAVATAEAAGITLVAVARDDGFEVFTHPARLRFPPQPARAHVA